MFQSYENKLKIGILAVLFIGLSIIFIHHQLIISEGAERESEKMLYHAGIAYENKLRSAFVKYTSLAELTSLSIAKNIDNPLFNSQLLPIFHDVLYRSPELKSVEFILKNPVNYNDSSQKFLNLLDDVSNRSFRLDKSESGEIIENEITEYRSEKLKIAIEKNLISDQTRLLSPEILNFEGQETSVVPVFSSIYKGQQFVGYIIFYLLADWKIVQNEKLINESDLIEIFIAAPGNKLLSLNKNNQLVEETVDKACLTCKDLLGNKGTDYNASVDGNLLTVCIPWKLEEQEDYWHICIRAPISELHGLLAYKTGYPWIISILVIILATLAILYLFGRYSSLYGSINGLAKKLVEGDVTSLVLEEKLPENSMSGKLKNRLLEIRDFYNQLIVINKSLIKGDNRTELTLDLDKHKVFQSNKELYSHLNALSEKLESERKNLHEITSMTDGLEKINEVLKKHHDDLELLSIEVIKKLVDILGIEMGAFFLMKNVNSETFLELVVSYAYSENRFQKRRFKLGESLVGACAAEKRTIYLKKVPEDYLKIISGLGLASPQSILIIPLVIEGKVLGVIELGALKDFDDFSRRFSERAANTIANTLSMAEVNIRTSELLEKTRQQTLELEEHELKMNQAINDLKDLQAKTAKSEASVRAKLDAMNNTLMVVEYTSKGILLDANYKYLNTMNYALEDIKGIDVLELLKEEDRAELIKIINTVKNGNFYEGIIRRPTRQGVEKWLLATYSPVFNEQNVVDSILFFAIDISRLKKNEEQLKQKLKELKNNPGGKD